MQRWDWEGHHKMIYTHQAWPLSGKYKMIIHREIIHGMFFIMLETIIHQDCWVITSTVRQIVEYSLLLLLLFSVARTVKEIGELAYITIFISVFFFFFSINIKKKKIWRKKPPMLIGAWFHFLCCSFGKN